MTTAIAVSDQDRCAGADPHETKTSIYLPACSSCGAITLGDRAVFVFQDAVFCEDCWHDLPISERDRVAREIALRGVPLS